MARVVDIIKELAPIDSEQKIDRIFYVMESRSYMVNDDFEEYFRGYIQKKDMINYFSKKYKDYVKAHSSIPINKALENLREKSRQKKQEYKQISRLMKTYIQEESKLNKDYDYGLSDW